MSSKANKKKNTIFLLFGKKTRKLLTFVSAAGMTQNGPSTHQSIHAPPTSIKFAKK
jgi:hypothetical protein